MNDWLRVTAIGGGDYECRMTILKTDGTTITVTRPWHHHWTDGRDDSAMKNVRLIVTADNKVGLYDADGKALK